MQSISFHTFPLPVVVAEGGVFPVIVPYTSVNVFPSPPLLQPLQNIPGQKCVGNLLPPLEKGVDMKLFFYIHHPPQVSQHCSNQYKFSPDTCAVISQVCFRVGSRIFKWPFVMLQCFSSSGPSRELKGHLLRFSSLSAVFINVGRSTLGLLVS